MWNATQAGTLAIGVSALDICSLGMRIWWLLIIYHVALALAIIGLFTKCVPSPVISMYWVIYRMAIG